MWEIGDGPGDPEWRLSAACRGLPVDHFFTREGSEGHDEAVKLCVSCPAQSDCLAEILAVERSLSKWAVCGVYGGLAASERVALLNEAQAWLSQCPECGESRPRLTATRTVGLCADCRSEHRAEHRRSTQDLASAARF